MLRIQAAGVTFLGRPDEQSPRVEGLFVGPDGFEGWEDGGGDTRSESVDRPAAHGEFDSPVFLGSRVITIDGHALAWSPAELGHIRNRVMGLGGNGDRFQLTVEHQQETLWASARRGTKPTFKDAGIRHGLLRARFSVHLVCRDPRKYGEVRTFGPATALTVFQYGNFPGIPELIITGAMPSGYAVHGPDGKQFIVSQALSADQTHRLDFRTGRLYRDNVLQIGAVSNGGTWTIPVGSAVPMTLAPVSGAGSMTVRVPDTFI